MIYLNNAATTAAKPESYYSADSASEGEAKEKLACLFGCDGEYETILTEGGSQAIKAAIYGLIRPGDHVISTDMEYGETLEALNEIEGKGCTVSYIPVNSYGTVMYELIERAVNDKTRAIVCCHGSNVTGNMVDLGKVGLIARRNNLLLISDGCQTAGAAEIRLSETGADAFCFTGHKKLMGPYGTGGICLRKGIELSRDAESVLTAPSEEKLGKLCASLDFIREKGLYGVSILPHRLAKRFFEAVKSMKDVKVYGDFGTNMRIPTVAISVEGFSAQEIKEFMRKKGIVVRSGGFDSPRLMRSFGMEKQGLVRFSFGYFNTRRDVNEAILALMELLGIEDFYLLS